MGNQNRAATLFIRLIGFSVLKYDFQGAAANERNLERKYSSRHWKRLSALLFYSCFSEDVRLM